MTKKICAACLSLILLLLCNVAAFGEDVAPAGFGQYKHVIIVGFDGLGAMWEKIDSPNFDRIFASGAYRYNAAAETVTISAQNWGSILTGVDADVHGLTNDNISNTTRTSETSCPSLFVYARKAFPDARLVSYNNWYRINEGIIETDIGVEKYDARTAEHETEDAVITQEVVDDLSTKDAPLLLFVHLNDPDHYAHKCSSSSKDYRQACMTADAQLGAIYDAAEENGLLNDGLFIVTADHGENGYGHGGTSVEESSVVVGVVGNGVSRMILPKDLRNRDVAAITLYALGIQKPAQMSARLPQGLFGSQTDSHVHSFDDGVVTVSPTCTKDGEKVFTCLFWDAEQIETLDAYGHVDENSDEKCDRCGMVLSDAIPDEETSGKPEPSSGGFNLSSFFSKVQAFFVRLFHAVKGWFKF